MSVLPEGIRGEASYLEGMLDNFSASYKLYWFKGIFAEIMQGNTHISFRRIIARMIAAAWYPVAFFRLSLGYSDKLSDAIWYIHNNLNIPREIKENDLIEFICNCGDQELNRKINNFMNMVPYRLIRPFYDSEIEVAKREQVAFADHQVNPLILRLNQRSEDAALYRIDIVSKTIDVRENWLKYIHTNAAVIDGWINFKLIEYLQQRNPNVPAIPFKIFPPQTRNLTEAKNLWVKIAQNYQYNDLYSGLEFSDENIDTYGRISIDHFIPWSFVLHDELWNLCPTFKNVNSQKGNRLPDLEYYLDGFCSLQYNAFIAARAIPIKNKTLESYQGLNSEIFEVLPNQDKGRDLFYKAIRNTIQPLYQIARNQGYNTWIF